mgnify:CR=1 FL=1
MVSRRKCLTDQPALAELMRRCAVLVLPSFYEGVPLVLAEARACGCRLVATDLPDWPAVRMDPDRCRQLFLNLLLNALEAMPGGGRLQVSTAKSEDPAGVRLTFSDCGRGIPAAALERVFEPFYSTKQDSLGLGLFISHSIVQEHAGRLEVDSQEGVGTTFSIWLPLPEP